MAGSHLVPAGVSPEAYAMALHHAHAHRVQACMPLGGHMLQTTPPPPLPQQSSQTPGHPYTQYTHSNTHHSQSQQQQQQ
ncbi:unnamed protein product, partial [Protopolystoma xenopodis]